MAAAGRGRGPEAPLQLAGGGRAHVRAPALLSARGPRRARRRGWAAVSLAGAAGVVWGAGSAEALRAPPRRGRAEPGVGIVAADEPLPREYGSLSVLSYNVLLPNSEDGWWLYKNYLPEVPEEARTWPARKALLRDVILSASADVVCLQEASGRSPFEQDFDFMFQDGYEGTLLARGRMRCATFWRPERVELAREPLSKDRTLITPFQLRGAAGEAPLVWVVNAHLAAGPQPGRRLRQAHDALETVRKERGRMGADDHAPAVVFCGDLNADDELEGATAVNRLLVNGSVKKGYVDPHHAELGPISSKNRKQACGCFTDAYAAVFPEGTAPATLIAPELIDRFFDSDRTSMTSGLNSSLVAMFDRYSSSSAAGEQVMDQAAVDRWLIDINRNSTRGSEYRAALAAFERNGGAFLTRGDFARVYWDELEAGKFWGVAYDLWATESHGGCLPEPSSASMELELFEARFDRIYFTGPTLELTAVRWPRVVGATGPLPSQHEPSDHLPVGAALRLLR